MPKCAQCAIELVSDDSVLKFGCNHCFHWACVYPLIKARDACPQCPPESRFNQADKSVALQMGSDPDYEQALEVCLFFSNWSTKKN